MLGRERLIICTKWVLETVRQEQIRMRSLTCCWAGWMFRCPDVDWKDEVDDGLAGGWRDLSTNFNITGTQAYFMFGVDKSGDKRDILDRLHTVLKQPGPYPEPEIEHLDKEWAELQRLLEPAKEPA